MNVACAWLLAAAVPALIVRYWFMEGVGHAAVFWTNFAAQATVFVAGLVLFAAAVVWPVRAYAVSASLRRGALHAGTWVGLLAGWLWSSRYQEYLLAWHGGAFGEVDPVFGHDVGFYVFVLPSVQTTRLAMLWWGVVAAGAAIVGRFDELKARGVFADPDATQKSKLTRLATRWLNGAMTVVGLSLVAQTFLARYVLLVRDNGPTGVRTGASYVDVEGFFSTLNLVNTSIAVELGIMAVGGYALHQTTRYHLGHRFRVRPLAGIVATLLAVDLAFFLALAVRTHVFVAPNEPTIQLPYITRHIAATTRGYRLDRIETVDWRPPAAPLTADELLASATVRSAPLLPGWVSSLEEPPDVQHFERVRTSESTMVYGPMLQVFEQEQQLRPYYKFVSVDNVRYAIDGRKQMFVSAVRELPSRGFAGPKQWLSHWGSAAMMLTHGLGLVMSPANELRDEGGPQYAVTDVPPHATHPTFDVEPRIYFGEGAKDDYILTGVRHLRELDYATRQFRRESVYDPPEQTGMAVDSLFKRIVLAAYTGDVNEFLFSDFIDRRTTRAHVFRTPIQRVSTVAPFLFLDSNVFAFAADSKVLWMVNALTTSNAYPYSFHEQLGDKADERAVEQFPERRVNYAEDSVKVTIDAYTGALRFYKVADDPIVNAWARVYPGLFEADSAMPRAVEDQLTYPLQWFHIQFDDIYKRYHQKHPVEFYNAEDLWDDADEVVGSIGRGLTEFGTRDQMTFSYEGYQVLLDPADVPAAAGLGPPGSLQYATLMPFTPEGARNLRSVVVALQDRGQYGRLLNLRVPQGVYLTGPEQADTLIDNDAQVNQQITLWVRHGSEVVRGHTLLLPVGGDVLYIEPLWIVSLQNQLPQIKLVSVVYRNRTAMGTTLTDALRQLAVSEADEQRRSELPWFGEAQAGGR
jgi:uncharacterized membrane protein (UPF0182 family)